MFITQMFGLSAQTLGVYQRKIPIESRKDGSFHSAKERFCGNQRDEKTATCIGIIVTQIKEQPP